MKRRQVDYTKQYRKKIVTRGVIIIGSVIILSLVIISYLGSLAGNYTVRLSRDNRCLSMADNVSFDNPTTRLRAEQMKGGTIPVTIDDLPNDDILDADNSKSHNAYNIGPSGGCYLAYTFYVKNSGTDPMSYYVEVNIEKMIKASSSSGNISLDEILRVMIYENTVSFDANNEIVTKHDKTIFAKKIDVSKDDYHRYGTLEDGQIDDRECVAYDDKYSPVCFGRENYRAVAFNDDSTIIKRIYSIGYNEIVRYTVVMWFEGSDPECQNEAPVGAGLTLSMSITGIN